MAGKQAGGDKGSNTRSSLMYETIRIVEELRPKYVIWENVKNLLSKKHRHNFDAYLETMVQLGYTNYYQVLNAKDYGIPQNRERVFTVSILNNGVVGAAMRGRYNNGKIEQHLEISDREYANAITTVQKDCLVCEKNKQFTFPPKQELKLKLKDILEDEVDEKYYLSEEMVDKIRYSKFAEVARNMEFPKILDDRDKGWGIKISDICPTQRANRSGIKCIQSNLIIRKLTPKECWRLMGFDDSDFEKAKAVNSDTQLYKQAGNSIVVNVIEAIYNNLLVDY